MARRPGTNTQIIGVFDAVGKDFGTIDVRTASVLAPLMDARNTSKVRLQALLESREKLPYEYPGQQISQHIPIRIHLYAPRKLVNGIGKLFSQKQVWLRHPLNVDAGVEIVNPHEPKDHTPKKSNQLVASTSRYASGSTVQRTTEQVKRDVLNLFDSLPDTEDLPKKLPVPAIKTPLLQHQKQALYWMTDRELDKRDDPEAKDEASLWEENMSHNGVLTWYHIITGHQVKEKPEPILGGILADVMGLGKTLNTLSLICGSLASGEAEKFGQQKPPKARFEDDNMELAFNTRATLLICPLSTISNWEEQIKIHLKPKTLEYEIYHGPNRTDDPEDLQDLDLVITSYSVVKSNKDWKRKKACNPLMALNWFRIVLDEGHTIREISTMQSKAVCELSGQRRWAITGTPVQNRLDDLGALLKFLKVRPFDEPRIFAQFMLAPFKAADTDVISKLRVLVDSITLRRLKDKLDLPPREELPPTKLEMTDSERRFYDFYSRESSKNVSAMIANRDKIAGNAYAHVLRAILRLRLICAHGSDLLSDEDWKQAQGYSMNNAIDLEDDDFDKPMITTRKAIEMFRLMTDASAAMCALCNSHVKAKEIVDDESDREEEDYDHDEGEEESRADFTVCFVTSCNQLLCKKCVGQFKQKMSTRIGPDNYGSCYICETYMHAAVLELKQRDLDADEKQQRELRANPRLAKQMGRYSGPHTKVRALIEALKENEIVSASLPTGEPPIKSVIFSGWTSYLDLIQLALKNEDITTTRLDGSMPRSNRSAALDSFSKDPDIACILVSVTAGGLGLNLTAASRVYVMEPLYNPAQESQAIERVHRLGQKRAVKITKFVMKDSIEEKMLVLQNRKRELANMSLDKNYKIYAVSSAKQKLEDLKSLFK